MMSCCAVLFESLLWFLFLFPPIDPNERRFKSQVVCLPIDVYVYASQVLWTTFLWQLLPRTNLNDHRSLHSNGNYSSLSLCIVCEGCGDRSHTLDARVCLDYWYSLFFLLALISVENSKVSRSDSENWTESSAILDNFQRWKLFRIIIIICWTSCVVPCAVAYSLLLWLSLGVCRCSR